MDACEVHQLPQGINQLLLRDSPHYILDFVAKFTHLSPLITSRGLISERYVMFQFPFGQPLKRVTQHDTTPNKKVFVLGVYASAVHARWIGANGKEIVKALAVASEPNIFWKGENAEEIIAGIDVPNALGRLAPPSDSTLNGPSGRALDKLYLEKLGIGNRDAAWLCDLLPESRINESQRKAITTHYTDELIATHNLNRSTIPDFNENELRDNASQRHLEILAELKASHAGTVILLGDLPIKWFLNFFTKEYTTLAEAYVKFGTYGQPHEVNIDGSCYNVIPLCHPRNAAKLGAFSSDWTVRHAEWKPVKL